MDQENRYDDHKLSEERIDLKLRDYQERLYKKCIKENLIICLPTGSGKTMIAIWLINHFLKQTLGIYPEKAKRTFFLAPKRVLVLQQFRVIQKFVNAQILILTGDDNPDEFDENQWMMRLQKNQVFVMTPDILLGYIHFTNINLMIFDEMHWAFKNGTEPSNHPYSRIMMTFNEIIIQEKIDQIHQPRIIALSASIFSNDSQLVISSIEFSLQKIEQLYHARIESGGFSYIHKYEEEIVPFDSTCFLVDIGFDFDKLLEIFNQFRSISYLKQFRLTFVKIQSLLEKMGVWFALEYTKILCNSLLKNPFELSDIMLQIIQYISKCIHHWLEKKLSNAQEDNPLFIKKLISNKIQILIKIIQEFHSNYTHQSFTGILFVAERTDANLLFRWLKLLSYTDKNLNFLKVGFLCGSLRKDFIHFDFHHNQEECLNKLRNKEINFVVATSVLEEGIDIPICNIVIRYDGVDNYRAYCQSRGRARHEKSHFYIMVPQEDYLKLKRKIVTYKKMDNILVNIKSKDYIECCEENRVSKNYDIFDLNFVSSDLNDLYLIKPYLNGESLLYPRESLQLLNKYLMKLPKDLFTEQQMPLVLFKKCFSNNDIKTKYAYVFIFPINSNYNGIVIKGAYFQKKKNAALHCAFRTCKFLIDHGDIDQHLNVYRKQFILQKHVSELNIRYMAEYDNENELKTRCHVNKTSDYFQAIIDGNSLSNENSNCYYLYAIEFFGNFEALNLNAELSNQLYRPMFVSQTKDIPNNDNDDNFQTIGVLLLNRYSLDYVQSYFYFNLFPIKFQLKFCGSVNLSHASILDPIKFFHQHVLTTVFFERLKLDKSSHLNSSFYIVPMKKESVNLSTSKYSIDFEFIQTIENWVRLYEDANQNPQKCAQNYLRLDELKPYNPESPYMHPADRFTIFACTHQQSIRLYFVKNISDKKCTDLMIKPCKNFPNGQTYSDYYQTKYKLTILDQQTPMVNAGLAKTFQINYHLNRQKCTIMKRMNSWAILFPLELIKVYPLSSAMYLQIASLPILLYRLEQYFLGKEFLHSLSEHINLNYQNEEFHIEDILLHKKFVKEVHYDENLNEKNVEFINIESTVDEDYRKDQKASVTKAFEEFLDEEMSESNFQLQNFIDKSEQEKLFRELLDKIHQIELTIRSPKKYINNKDENIIDFGEVSILKFTGDIDEYIRRDQLTFNSFQQFDCPNPWHIVQGLTLSKADDSWNIERLETIGDSFIKFACSVYLFFKYPNYNEMKFDCLKISLVNNKNLFKIAMEKGIAKYIFCSLHQAIPLNFFKRLIINDFVETEGEYRPGLKYKDMADCVESLIGAFLIYGGAGSALKFLNDFLDLKSFDPKQIDENILNDFLECKLNEQLKILGSEVGVDPNNHLDEIHDEEIKQELLEKFEKQSIRNEVERLYHDHSMYLLEEEIGYQFKQKYLLIQAFTHSSMYKSEDSETGELTYNFIPSYQRLEFIGDAILDYSITRYVYHKDHSLDPTDITLLKQALVNNVFYASISVKYGLHKFVRHSSFDLKIFIYKFVNRFIYKYIEQIEDLLLEGMDEESVNDINNIDVPKILADVFEALVGAIFIDCHFDLDLTWRVVYKMIKIEIDHFMKKVPLMPLFRLSQFYQNFHFGEVKDVQEESSETNYRPNVSSRKMIELYIDGVGSFIGYGRNKKQCKISATKRFFLYERKQKQQENTNQNRK